MTLATLPSMLAADFFARDPVIVAQQLLGKRIFHRCQPYWLCAQIIETEAYYLTDKGSHASLGFTEKRKALFMPAGTIYMYYARGGDSLNISCHGAGNAVLIKSAIAIGNAHALAIMQRNNPIKTSGQPRPLARLCSGQTLLCRALGLKVTKWNQQQFDPQRFYFAKTNYRPTKIIQTTRLGIPIGRDEHLLYRFIDYAYAKQASQNPLTKKGWQLNRDYFYLLV